MSTAMGPRWSKVEGRHPHNQVDCFKCGEKTDRVSGFTLGEFTSCQPCWRKWQNSQKDQRARLDALTPDVVKSEAFLLLNEVASL